MTKREKALAKAAKDLLNLWPLRDYELDGYCDATLVPALRAALALPVEAPPRGAQPPPDLVRRVELVEEARKALRCLYLMVPESVARDVGTKVEAALAGAKEKP
jgi:hypothetical protein